MLNDNFLAVTNDGILTAEAVLYPIPKEPYTLICFPYYVSLSFPQHETVLHNVVTNEITRLISLQPLSCEFIPAGPYFVSISLLATGRIHVAVLDPVLLRLKVFYIETRNFTTSYPPLLLRNFFYHPDFNTLSMPVNISLNFCFATGFIVISLDTNSIDIICFRRFPIEFAIPVNSHLVTFYKGFCTVFNGKDKVLFSFIGDDRFLFNFNNILDFCSFVPSYWVVRRGLITFHPFYNREDFCLTGCNTFLGVCVRDRFFYLSYQRTNERFVSFSGFLDCSNKKVERFRLKDVELFPVQYDVEFREYNLLDPNEMFVVERRKG